MRKEKEVTVGKEKFTLVEIKVRDMMSIMPRLGDEAQASEATMDLMKLCVFQDGHPLGDALEEMGLSTYMELVDPVMEVNGLKGKT